MPEAEKAAKKPPKGGRKGGTLYPKLNLKQALDIVKSWYQKHTLAHSPQQPFSPECLRTRDRSEKCAPRTSSSLEYSQEIPKRTRPRSSQSKSWRRRRRNALH